MFFQIVLVSQVFHVILDGVAVTGETKPNFLFPLTPDKGSI